ncbi:MAG TPA: hypothetical protein VK177_14975 [Flavobacteriales bacterium]|nr:hypothetical protein [Flavobacteriales bacterium]
MKGLALMPVILNLFIVNKHRNYVFVFALIFIVGTITGCVKSENFFAYGAKKINEKIIPGTWDIEQLEIWIIDDYQSQSALANMVFSDVGNFEFKAGGACHFNLNGGELDATYLTLYSSDEWKWEYLSGSFSLGEHFNGNVMYLDKKEMMLHFPWTLNLWTTDKVIMGKSVEFRFKLNKQ